ncbi:MAG: ATP-dependent DNA ligase [Rhodobacteraceae bacterium]|uniref:ATP dependent DNA ligase n=1 Tax=Marivita sp. TaxID=2003365 RepID=UPI003B52DEE2|nr:ATP-dependent DNA ligase [Paracoccaceae bacterium]
MTGDADIAALTKGLPESPSMRTMLTDDHFSDADWFYARVLVFRDCDRLRLTNRNWHDMTETRPERVQALAEQPALHFEDPLRYKQHRTEEGGAGCKEACDKGWEALIAKDLGAHYLHSRSRKWLQFKCAIRVEPVIGGFTESKTDSPCFSSLLPGDCENGTLRYADKVGTGLEDTFLTSSSDMLDDRRDTSPLLSDAVDEDALWLRPDLVAEIGFTEWTMAEKLRHPRPLDLRRDKRAEKVTREVAGT